jgi:hypothetical protein
LNAAAGYKREFLEVLGEFIAEVSSVGRETEINAILEQAPRAAERANGHEIGWEYRDLIVPLDLPAGGWTRHFYVDRSVRDAGDKLINAAVQEAGREGWVPDGLYRFQDLMYDQTRLQTEGSGFGKPATYKSIRIPLKRPVV